MIRQLQLQRKADKTIETYVTSVAQLASYYDRSPERISREEVRDYIHYLIVERQLAPSSVNTKLAGIQFLYQHVLGQAKFDLKVNRKRSGRLPQPLSRREVRRLLDATSNPKHRVMLMTACGGGLPTVESSPARAVKSLSIIATAVTETGVNG
jgi:site-specific recombinase XerD